MNIVVSIKKIDPLLHEKEKKTITIQKQVLQDQINYIQWRIDKLTEGIKIKSMELERVTSRYIYYYKNISTDKKMFKSATGFDHDFLSLFRFLNARPQCENVKFWLSGQR